MLNIMPNIQFRQFCKVADMFVKALDEIYLICCRKAPFERLKRDLPASLETKYQFPRQGWRSLKFKVNYLMKMDKW